jgi:hypothetical protein
MNPNYSINFDGYPQTTVAFTASDDTAQSLSDMSVNTTNGDGDAAIMAVFSVEDNACRVCFNGTATDSLGHNRDDGETFQVAGKYALDNMTLINASAGSNFTVMITVFYASPDVSAM